jgi:16S rRNA processing protein RimM
VVNQQHEDNPQPQTLLRVCRIGRAQGLKGEVNVHPFTDEPERRFESGSVLYTQDGSRKFTVLRSRASASRWIVLFQGVDDRNASEALNGLDLYVPEDDRDTMLAQDAWYPKDLVGLEVRIDDGSEPDMPRGQVVGTVVDVIDAPAQSLLKIRLAHPTEDERTSLVPFVDELVPTVDIDAGYLTVNPPHGLIAGL